MMKRIMTRVLPRILNTFKDTRVSGSLLTNNEQTYNPETGNVEGIAVEVPIQIYMMQQTNDGPYQVTNDVTMTGYVERKFVKDHYIAQDDRVVIDEIQYIVRESKLDALGLVFILSLEKHLS